MKSCKSNYAWIFMMLFIARKRAYKLSPIVIKIWNKIHK